MCCLISFLLVLGIITAIKYVKYDRDEEWEEEIKQFNSRNEPKYTLAPFRKHGYKSVPP